MHNTKFLFRDSEGGGGNKLTITNNGNAKFRSWLAAECTVNTKFVAEKTGT